MVADNTKLWHTIRTASATESQIMQKILIHCQNGHEDGYFSSIRVNAKVMFVEQLTVDTA